MVHESSFTRERMCLIIPFTYKPFINFLRKLQISSTPRFFYRAKYFSIVNHHIYAHTHYTHKIAAVEMWNRLCKQSKIAWIWCMVSYLLLPLVWFVCFFFSFLFIGVPGQVDVQHFATSKFQTKTHTYFLIWLWECLRKWLCVTCSAFSKAAKLFNRQRNSFA